MMDSQPAITPQLYGLYKNFKDTSKYAELNNVLADLAAADTIHDFSDIFTGTTLNETYRDSYNKGLPTEFRTALNEEEALKLIFEDKNNIQNVPLNKIGKIRESYHLDGKYNEVGDHMKATTINGNNYTIRYCDVKPAEKDAKGNFIKGKYIEATDYFGKLGLNAGKQNLAFVVDCTSVSIDTVMTNGARNNDIKVYLIKSSEIENDPGGKKKLDDPSFKQDTGVIFKPAIPFNIVDGNKEYYYTFDSNMNTPLNQFFTNYVFKLSELKYAHKYISSKLSTTLTILPSNSSAPILTPIDDSGDKNEIKFLSKIINNLLNMFKKKEKKFTTNNQEFEFVASLQQKRSGDWLQALLCCLIANDSREFCEYTPEQGILKKKDLVKASNKPENKIKFDKVYLVTHDRILLAFALLLGIDVMFTHHYSSNDLVNADKKKISISSVLLYTITNPLEEKANQNTYLNNFKDDLPKLISELKTQQTDLNSWNTNINNINNGNKSDLNDFFTKKEYTKYEDYLSFEKGTQEIFKRAFKLHIIKSNLPDLTNIINRLTELYKIFIKLEQNINSLTYEDAIKYSKELNNFTVEYLACKSQVDKLELGNTLKYIKNVDFKLKKNAAYQLILAWKISNHPKLNLWNEYQAVVSGKPNTTYMNDKNIFLYELNRLDDDLKKSICEFYYKWYEEIYKVDENNKTTYMKLPIKLIQKLKANMLSFSFEVFINFDISEPNDSFKTKIDTIISGLKDVDKKIVEQTQTLPINSEEKKEMIDVVANFNEIYNTNNESRLNTIISEQMALDGIKLDSVIINDEPFFSNAIAIDGEVINQVNANSIIDEKTTELYKSSNPQKIDEEIKNNLYSYFTPAPQAQASSSDKINPETEEEAVMVGGLKISDKYKFIYNYENVTAPIILNVVNMFSDKLFIQKNKGINSFEELLSFIFGNLPSSMAYNNAMENTLQIDTILHELKTNIEAQDSIRAYFISLGLKITPFYEGIIQKVKNNIMRQHPLTGGIGEKMQVTESLHTSSSSSSPSPSLNAFLQGNTGPEYRNIKEMLEKNDLSVKNDDIFINDKMSFHPLLPVFLILHSYCYQLSEVPIEECWEFDIYITYILIINAIVKKMVESYSGENNNNINKFIAIIHGYGLRELLFTGNQYNEWTSVCMQSLGLENKLQYNEFSGLSSVLSNKVAGEINQTDKNKEFGKKCIANPIFSAFMSEINAKHYFQHTILSDSVGMTDFRKKVMQYYLKVGEKINNDQKGVINEEVDYYLRTNTILEENPSLQQNIPTMVLSPPKTDTEKLLELRKIQGPPTKPSTLTSTKYKELKPMGTMTSLLKRNNSLFNNPNYIYNTFLSTRGGSKRTKRRNKHMKKKYTRRNNNNNNKTRKQTRRKNIIKKKKYSISKIKINLK